MERAVGAFSPPSSSKDDINHSVLYHSRHDFFPNYCIKIFPPPPGLILVPNGKYLGRLVGDEYPTRQVEDDPLQDEPAGPGGRMLDLNYDTDDGPNNKDGGTSRNNVTRYDYR